LGIGEVLWDLLPDGQQFGGAPANFACHAQALGANAAIITRVGRDAHAREILRRLIHLGLPRDGVPWDASAPTGTVTVRLSGGGLPESTIQEDAAWDHIGAGRDAPRLFRAARAICFGTLAQRGAVSRHSIRRLLASASSSAWRVCDINLRQNYFNREVIEHSLNLASVLKLNDGEIPALAPMFGLEGDLHQQMESLAKRFGLQVVALTCGGRGSVLCQSHHGNAGRRWTKQRRWCSDDCGSRGRGEGYGVEAEVHRVHSHRIFESKKWKR
jgi:fructokinase